VERTYHPIRVPMGQGQLKAHRFWLDRFADYFSWKYPHHPLVDAGLVEKWAAALGQLWHLEYAATLPGADDSNLEWPYAAEKLGKMSNFTPSNLKVLELAMQHAAKGAQVLCAGVNAMKLGHNLDVASVVIVHGLPYSHMAMDQFIARVHRLTSKKPVSVYVVVPRGSLAQRKWDLLKDKGGAADLAFDGEISAQQEDAVDWNKVLADMKERGIRAEGDELLEADVEKAWNEIPKVNNKQRRRLHRRADEAPARLVVRAEAIPEREERPAAPVSMELSLF
jgi:hypothetical protein